ncbi:MAG: FtsW/RodA/SpoVE family cell cycle protein [Bacteroidia bacterium]|nr:FtsW/RodA/SpoVE family cell cycle protein [Bacteroidia bacterium]
MIRWLLLRLKGDKIIWILVFLLSMVSMLAIFSSTSALSYRMQGGDVGFFVGKHVIILLAGLVLMFIVHLIDYRVFARFTNAMIFITIAFLLYTIVQGSEINEAARWVNIFGLSFQPSDLAKITLVVYLAKLLTVRQDVIRDFTEGFLPALFWVMVICGLIAPSDLHTASLMFIASVMVMFIAGIDLKYIGVLAIVACLGLVILVNTAKRSTTWKSRWGDYIERITDAEYDGNAQTVSSNVAIATGGLLGKGVGKSSQRNFLPLAHSDFVFAIIVEEYGLVGGAFVVMLYVLLLFRSVSIVTVSKTFGALMASGLAFILVLQAMMNMGVTVGLLPVTGLTLPIISLGGTSLLTTSVSLGIILSVSRDAIEKRKALGTDVQPAWAFLTRMAKLVKA